MKGATWSLVGLDSFSQALAFALPMPSLSAGLGRKIDGIIGGEFIKQFVLELNYQARSIRLHDTASIRYAGPGKTLPIEFTSGRAPDRRSHAHAARRNADPGIGFCSTWARVSRWRSTARSWPNTTSSAATSEQSEP